jgi:hypothetical protein
MPGEPIGIETCRVGAKTGNIPDFSTAPVLFGRSNIGACNTEKSSPNINDPDEPKQPPVLNYHMPQIM